MSHFVELNNQDIVVRVIVAEQDFIDQLPNAASWLQTSYNTRGGVHLLGGVPLRKNYAGIGDTYDRFRDAFYKPQPYPSWVLNEDTCLWDAPTSMPQDGKIYLWDEPTKSWVEVQPKEGN